MKGYCATVKLKDMEWVLLIEVEADCDPAEAITRYCKKYRLLHDSESINAFPVRDIETLKKIEWPEHNSEAERAKQQQAKLNVYRVFEIKQTTLGQALDALDNPVITRARGLGWNPKDTALKGALEHLIWSLPTQEQAEAYRASIIDMIDDIEQAVSTTEDIFEQMASEFLDEEAEPSGLKEPITMASLALIDETRELFNSGLDESNILRYKAMEKELLRRGYEIHIVTEQSSTLPSISIRKEN